MFEPFVLTDKSFFSIDHWTKQFDGLVAGFTTKTGGVSEAPFQSLNFGFHVRDQLDSVCSNREAFSQKIDIPVSNWIGAEQTHETAIARIEKKDRGKGAFNYETSIKATDGFYTEDANVLLTLCFADCVPLFFIAPTYKRIGIAHAGWKGTVHGIADEMVKLWIRDGIATDEIYAVIGPSICQKCYVVDDRVIQFVKKRLEGTGKKTYNQISEGQYSLDLKALNTIILQKSGIPSHHISVTSLCTSCQNDSFFSHRRDNGKTGRMMSFIGWKEE